MAEKEYQRLTWARLRRTGAFSAFATRSSLWLGKDHLLCVDSTGFAEEYKRFYFRDIQAVTLMATRRRLIWNWLLGVPLAGCIGAWGVDLVSTPSMSTGGMIAGVVITLLFALPLLINNLYGPSCACHLRTAVQSELMPSLNRLRRARKVLARIRPLIEAAQGSLTPEEIASSLANSPDAPPVIARYKSAPAALAPRHYPGTAHRVLFWLLVADVPLSAVYILFHSEWMDLASAVLLLVTVACVIASLLKQHNTTLPAALKRLPWLVLGWTALLVMTAIAYGIVLAINDPEALDRSMSPLEDTGVLVMTLISTAGSAALGVVGLVLLRKHRASSPATGSGQPAAGSQST